MTDAQFQLALEFLGTIDAATGLLLDGLNSQGGLDYVTPAGTGINSCVLGSDWPYVQGLETRDHSAVKEAFACMAG